MFGLTRSKNVWAYPFEKFAEVSPTRNHQVETPLYTRYANGEANGEGGLRLLWEIVKPYVNKINQRCPAVPLDGNICWLI